MALTDTEALVPIKTEGRFWRNLRQGFAAQSIFLVFVVAYWLLFKTSQVFNSAVVDNDVWSTLSGLALFSIPVFIFCMAIVQFYFVATIDNSKRPVKDLWRRMKTVVRHEDSLVRGMPLFLALLLFSYTFTIFKANITNFVAFSWDQSFSQLDKALHFGVQPWEWLQPIFGNLVGTFVLNVNYNIWFIIMQVFWVYFAFIHVAGLERTRFFLSFFLIWGIGGSLLAIVFSSAGPCYYGMFVDGVNPYAPLVQQLRAINDIVPIWAVSTQDMLWQARIEHSPLGGIAAMPSMHNSTTLLFVLTIWNKSKILRNLLIAHMILIALGSVHLAWHYAVDVYLAWAITFVLWIVADRISVWWEAREKVQVFNAKFVENI